MPYTDQTPKPLLMVDGISLLERNINGLYGAGIRDIVINTSWLGSHIQDFVTQLDLPGLHIACVHEGDTPLGTGGGIFNSLAHLVLVSNPDHNESGDFGLDGDLVLNESSQMHTFSGISCLSPDIFQGVNQSIFSLAQLLRTFVRLGLVKGELFLGKWLDVGTIERLNKADG